ncbi:hypothetical protein COL8621_00312 [Actibacterium lipolyticum]|uniref:Uncharacterized protein n=1 Tax=Actibacterium lipolyticum TaxID=1524263 RepID=A0A238JKH1_9RHOB|nr:hypothetical protein COL8621_00312 [Actibacterium lipolyticum]
MLVPLGLIVAFLLMLLFAKPGTRQCRWREDRRLNKNGETYFACVACGATTYCKPGKSPQTCLRNKER